MKMQRCVIPFEIPIDFGGLLTPRDGHDVRVEVLETAFDPKTCTLYYGGRFVEVEKPHKVSAETSDHCVMRGPKA